MAIKVLPEVFAHDEERLARFQREAELLATLNHPHIAAVYGLETVEGLTRLVLELVEGDTLADLIARGPLAIGDALSVDNCRRRRRRCPTIIRQSRMTLAPGTRIGAYEITSAIGAGGMAAVGKLR